jgi:hypothetical protein
MDFGINFAHFLWKHKPLENNMNVSSVTHGQHYTAHKPNASHNAKNFESILHEQNARGAKCSGESSKQEPENPSENTVSLGREVAPGLYEPILDDKTMARIQADTQKVSALKGVGFPVLGNPNCIEQVSRCYIDNALTGKVGVEEIDVWAVSGRLNDMLFSDDPDMNLETRTANREAAKNMAEYIAENYFDDPEEAQAFINTINKFAELSEAKDKGYIISSKYFVGNIEEQLDKHAQWSKLSDEEKISHISSVLLNLEELIEGEEPQSDFNRWLEKKGYRSEDAIIVKDDGFVYQEKLFYNSAGAKIEAREIKREYEEVLSAYEAAHPGSSIPRPWVEESKFGGWHFLINAKDWDDGLSWKQVEEKSCDPKYSMFSEENKAYYVDFYAKFLEEEQAMQSIIDNVKLTMDVSSNERWNVLMNLLSKAA